MKIQTAELLKKHLDNSKFEIAPVNGGLEFKHDLSDEEVLEIVEAEYSKTLTQSAEALFTVIVKELLRKGVEHAKAIAVDADKLSDL